MLKCVFSCAFLTISPSARVVSLASVLRVCRLSSSSLTALVFLVTERVVYRRTSLGASGIVLDELANLVLLAASRSGDTSP